MIYICNFGGYKIWNVYIYIYIIIIQDLTRRNISSGIDWDGLFELKVKS